MGCAAYPLGMSRRQAHWREGIGWEGKEATGMKQASDQGLAPGAIPVPADVATLRRLCVEFRRDLLELTVRSGTGSSHIGGELSLVEILAVLFFHTLKLDPKEPEWPGRDRFLLSKGHASAAMYVAMA